VHVEEGRPPGGLRVPVGHAGRHGLVQSQHVCDPVLAGQSVDEGQLGGPGIPEHMPDLLGLEDLEEDVGT
jgi:hypothetical protein